MSQAAAFVRTRQLCAGFVHQEPLGPEMRCNTERTGLTRLPPPPLAVVQDTCTQSKHNPTISFHHSGRQQDWRSASLA